MSTTAGVFSETQLQAIRKKAVDLLLDERIKPQFQPRTKTLDELFKRQTAKVNMVLNQEDKKNYQAQVWWHNVCGLVERDCDPCEFGGPQSSTNTKIYELDYCKEVAFSLPEYVFEDNDANFAEAWAYEILAAKKILSEGFTRYSIAQLNTFVGANALSANALGIVVGNNTYIPATSFTPNGLSYLLRVIEMNRFNNAWLLSGANFHQAYLNAMAGIKPEDNGNAWNGLPIVFDEVNIDSVNSPDLISYLISQGAYAIGNKAMSKPGVIHDLGNSTVRTLEKDPFLPLEYDLFIKKSCQEDATLYEAKLKLKAGFYNNPTGCDEGNTGVLNFICGDGN